MGLKRFTALFAFAMGLGVAGPAYAYVVVQDPALVVPANAPTDPLADPNIVAQSNAGSVSFAGAETSATGYIQALAAGTILFGGITSAAGAITATSTANGTISTNGALAAGGVVTLNAGTGDVSVGDLAIGATSSITGATITLRGALSVPSKTGTAQVTVIAGIATTATITLNLGPSATALVAGTHLHVFTWSDAAPRTVTAILGTAPALATGLKYSLADLAVGGDVVVIAACGDHVVDPGEACDDGNLTPGDGCSATCTIEIVDAGSDAGDAGTDAGTDAGKDASADAAVGDGGGDIADAAGDSDADGAVPSGSGSGAALPELGDIFGNDSSGCAFTPGVLAAPIPGAAALFALAALVRRRRRRS